LGMNILILDKITFHVYHQTKYGQGLQTLNSLNRSPYRLIAFQMSHYWGKLYKSQA
jgi:hypothetical protein